VRGNVVDLAVAVVIGGAFSRRGSRQGSLDTIDCCDCRPTRFLRDRFTVNGSKFLIGDFINAALAFVLVAAVIYFFVVMPMNVITERRRRGEAPADPTTKKCAECLSEVPVAAVRCAFCTQLLQTTAVRQPVR
jgi:large conductance mechanosensitive channel